MCVCVCACVCVCVCACVCVRIILVHLFLNWWPHLKSKFEILTRWEIFDRLKDFSSFKKKNG